jgi:hypothetical protein
VNILFILFYKWKQIGFIKFIYRGVKSFLYMAEKMTALWLIVLTMITCAAVPVFLVILTSPHPTQFITVIDDKLFDIQSYYMITEFPFIHS